MGDRKVSWRQTGVLLFTLAAAFCLLAGPIGIAAAKEYRLKIQSVYPRGDTSMELLTEFAAAAEKRSNGQLKVRVFADPEIFPGDQTFGAVKNGALDMLQGCGLYWSGIMPVASVEVGLPLTYRITETDDFAAQAEIVRNFFFKDGYIELLRREYAKQGLYLLDIHTYGPVPFVLATKPLKTLADLKGKKIRAEGINTEFHSGVGMHGTVIGGGETYMALKLGTVEAAEWDISAITGMNWHEVAPYWIRGMENDHTIGHILLSLKKWQSYPKPIQEALAGAGEDYWHATVRGYAKELATVRGLIKEGKVKEVMLDQAAQDKYAQVAKQILDDTAKSDPASAEAVQMIKKWRNIK
ncbi:MAG: TRAP transporter substrate-binding protein DctP [Desulfuromonadales bacterium]|nr:TRAP transporter substrate-binding protein DctP [Desulfuromonadales bacterium]